MSLALSRQQFLIDTGNIEDQVREHVVGFLPHPADFDVVFIVSYMAGFHFESVNLNKKVVFNEMQGITFNLENVFILEYLHALDLAGAQFEQMLKQKSHTVGRFERADFLGE